MNLPPGISSFCLWHVSCLPWLSSDRLATGSLSLCLEFFVNERVKEHHSTPTNPGCRTANEFKSFNLSESLLKETTCIYFHCSTIKPPIFVQICVCLLDKAHVFPWHFWDGDLLIERMLKHVGPVRKSLTLGGKSSPPGEIETTGGRWGVFRGSFWWSLGFCWTSL